MTTIEPSFPHFGNGDAARASTVGTPLEAADKTAALQDAIFHRANVALIATDETGIVQFFNTGAEQLLGFSAADVVNKLRADDFSDTEDAVAHAAALSEELATSIAPGATAITFRASRGIDESRELTLVRKDGSRFPALVLITALKDKPGIIIGYLLIATDNTARMQTQRDLTDANAEMEKVSLDKSDFLVQLSHELRTPLNVILGFAELMESGVPPSQKQSLAQIAVAGRYLLDLSNKILDLALIEAGRVTMSIEPVSLDDVMRECRELVALQATERRVRIKYPQFDLPCFVCADRTRLKQVLDNLLLNAIRHNNAGGTVDVDYLLDAKTPGAIRIRVRDNGEGLAPERLAQLFEPSNGRGQSARAEAGVGLGLVVAKQLIEKMGGHIGADSAVGVGSTFWIELKTTIASALVVPADDHSVFVPPLATNGTPPRTLLYVEDNPANLDLVRQLIARRPDLRLLTAADAVAGIESARVNQPEVILMDINLPGMNGVEAMKILSTLPSTAHIPVIALSANVMPADIANGLKAGFYLYLTKPIKFNLFMEALNKALDHSRTAAGASNIPDKTPG